MKIVDSAIIYAYIKQHSAVVLSFRGPEEVGPNRNGEKVVC